MEHVKGVRSSCSSISESSEEEMELRRGPWTLEEDFTLINHIALHGEGRWNSLARTAGLKRTGKSCRLRWLNYLRPDVRRGNITLEEQLLILQLHCRWGNRWSKIAQYLPGRTDNEIKNYWRTRVQKHAKQLKCDVNSKQFKDTMRYLWIPRLVERIQAAKAATATATATASAFAMEPTASTTMMKSTTTTYNLDGKGDTMAQYYEMGSKYYVAPENSSSTASASSDSFGPPVSDFTDYSYNCPVNNQGNNIINQDYDNNNYYHQLSKGESLMTSPSGYVSQQLQVPDFEAMEESNQWFDSGADIDICDNFWNAEDMWLLHQQLNSNL